ncbi:group II truncated hemoglobin [Novosphingobium sp. KN65.2]|uniref:group II truncated hemoglobin n=1 Tax=Novosphingobium sp. KN65.2 TaxID=1478134 RepID=UPI001E3AE358|nr:group II truncated hemoglobin [Novosphingobium sp. KN65.2]
MRQAALPRPAALRRVRGDPDRECRWSGQLNEASLFQRIGGGDTIDRLVDGFYDRMERIEEARTIRAMHREDLEPSRSILKRYLTEWLGGPQAYSSERGHPRMRMRHMHVPIDSAARDAWLLCMRGALDETVSGEAERAAIYEAMAKLADWMRNTDDSPA